MTSTPARRNSISQISVDELMEEIRRDLQTVAEDHYEPMPQPSPIPPQFTRPSDQSLSAPERSEWTMRDLEQYHDERFVTNAFNAILGRDPDMEGLSVYLDLLRTGRLSKVEIVGRIRFSVEGRSKGVKIRGLMPRYSLWTLFRIPVLGYLISLPYLVLRLPSLRKESQSMEQWVEQQQQRGAGQLEGHIDEVEDHFAALLARLNGYDRAVHQVSASLGSRLSALEQHVSEYTNQLENR